MIVTMAETIGERIRRLRLDRGWSQSQLAWLTDLSTAAISRIEAGNRKPTKRTIRDISRALSVSEAELRGE